MIKTFIAIFISAMSVLTTQVLTNGKKIMLLQILWVFAISSANCYSDQHDILEQYQWKNRIILVFAQSISDSLYQTCKEQIKDLEDEIIDRDLVIIHLLAKDDSTADDSLLSNQQSSQLRESYRIKADKFTVVLIGKDGGEKLRQVGRIDFKEIFGRIDAMPMRQSEMQERSQKSSVIPIESGYEKMKKRNHHASGRAGRVH
jgi:hypothetical protein